MGSKTIAVSSKKSGFATDAQKRLFSMKGLSDSTKSKSDEEGSSDEEEIREMHITDNKTDSDEVDDEMNEEDDEEMKEEESDEDVIEGGDEDVNEEGDEEIDEDYVSSSDEEEEGIGGDSKKEILKENMSDSSDEDGDGSRTMEDGDGVEFSDDDDLEDDEDQQNAEETEGNDIKVAANPAWAQAMAKILRTQKPSGKKAVALSKARTIQAAESAAVPKEEEPDFEIVGEKEGKPKIKSENAKPTAEELHEAKRQRLAFCRIKQEDFDYNRERALTKIATKGVVQLFNAVRSQQKNLGSKLAEAHSTRMEEKLLKSIDKDAFLEHLTGKIRSRPVASVQKAVKKEEGEIVLPKSWDELSKKVESSSWDKVIEIKDELED